MKKVNLNAIYAFGTLLFGTITLFRLTFIGGVHKALIGMYSGFPGRNGDHMYYTSMALQFAGKSYNQAINMAAGHFHDYPLAPSSLNFGYLDTIVAPLIYARQTLPQALSLGYELFGYRGFGITTLVIGLVTIYLLIQWVAREWGSTAAWATLMLAFASTFYVWYSTGIFIETIVLLIEVLWLYTLPVSRHYKVSGWNLLATSGLIFLLALTRQFPVLPIAVLLGGWVATYFRKRKVRNIWFLPTLLGGATSLVSYLLVNFWAPYSPAGAKAGRHFSLAKSVQYFFDIFVKDPFSLVILALAIYAIRKVAGNTLGSIAIAVMASCVINVYLATTEYRYWTPIFIYALPLAGLALVPHRKLGHGSNQKRYRGKAISLISSTLIFVVLGTSILFYAKGDGALLNSQHVEFKYGRKFISGEMRCYSNSARAYLEIPGRHRIALTGSAMAHNPLLSSTQNHTYQSVGYSHISEFIDQCLLDVKKANN
jgi:hypothetical protein